jgi:hypothetical protein
MKVRRGRPLLAALRIAVSIPAFVLLHGCGGP